VEQPLQELGEVGLEEVEPLQQVIQEEEMEHRVEKLGAQAELEFRLQLLDLPYFTLVVAVAE
jgi:hypothetical protein